MNDISFNNNTNEEIKDMATLEALINYATTCEKVDNVSFSITFINDDEMHALNKTYRNIDRTTDVLSFAFEDSDDIEGGNIRLLGDIYISLDRAKEQAITYEHSYLRELSFLMVHGFLHLLGYDHMKEDDEKKMFSRQEVILNEFGIKR